MKKILVLFVLLVVMISQAVFLKENTIYEIGIKKGLNNDGKIELQIKSDFNEKIKTVQDGKNSIYFDIENARLADDLKTSYNKNTSSTSIVAQQIGQKVRIYLKGANPDLFTASLQPNRNIKPVNYNPLYPVGAFMIFISLVAIYACSATMKLSKSKLKVKSTMYQAQNLNRSLYAKPARKVSQSGASNPVNSGVYVDFRELKAKRNTKIAI